MLHGLPPSASNYESVEFAEEAFASSLHRELLSLLFPLSHTDKHTVTLLWLMRIFSDQCHGIEEDSVFSARTSLMEKKVNIDTGKTTLT